MSAVENQFSLIRAVSMKGRRGKNKILSVNEELDTPGLTCLSFRRQAQDPEYQERHL
jgi:hypothetical protein